MSKPLFSLLPPPVEDDYQYVETIYSAFEASAVYCQTPLNYQRYFHRNLEHTGITGYSCPASKLPYDDFPGWDDPLTYSPACRGWYAQVRENQNQNVITSAYLFANEPIWALSLCAPLYDEEINFRGTTCIDKTVQGDLNEYWNFNFVEEDNESKNTFFIILNQDPALEEYDFYQKHFGAKKQLVGTTMNNGIKNAIDYEVWKKSEVFQIENIKPD